ncbi:TadE/TadG family type IV pilus assembly protein [Streptomyces sp. 6N223]|uniref:TadE/TadG family type IV pilus assembly protein n=1 Tax=Streptomyces sp. 6N223 TaxID=3457412 RepID=UPI003FD1ED88
MSGRRGRRLSRFVRRRLAHGADRGAAVARSDRGATAIEFVFLTPVLFFMIFGAVQFAMYSFAETVAKAAAQAGARTARAEAYNNDNWVPLSEETAHDYLDELGRGLFDEEPEVVATDTAPFTVQVTVQADVPSILPWIDLTVTATSEGPMERFTPDFGQ